VFYYFGRKGRLAPHYPAPAFPLVIEPFAGSMAYSLHYRPECAVGIDADLTVARVWNRIATLTPEQINSYPEPMIGDRVTDRWSMMAAGSHGTSRAQSYLWTERMSRDLAKQKRLAAKHRDYARNHVTYSGADYTSAPDVEATWFIDPPYQHVRRGYERESIDYAELADWVRSRRGQVIVCEQAGADWLPFVPLRQIRGTTNKVTTEVVWLEAIRAAA
jgi:hypothetical protein